MARILDRFEIHSLGEFDAISFPDEGLDYFENARQKAVTAARATGMVCVADDSGLEVEALSGAPGPLSARYGGPGLDDRGRLEVLLEALRGVPTPRRARFFCVAACARPDGHFALAEGSCEGELLTEANGAGGFGYDPIFRPCGVDRSMAELGCAEKDVLSHRGRAFRTLEPQIESLLGDGDA